MPFTIFKSFFYREIPQQAMASSISESNQVYLDDAERSSPRTVKLRSATCTSMTPSVSRQFDVTRNVIIVVAVQTYLKLRKPLKKSITTHEILDTEAHSSIVLGF